MDMVRGKGNLASTILQGKVKKRKVRWVGHGVRAKGNLASTILQGKVEMDWTWGKREGKPG